MSAHAQQSASATETPRVVLTGQKQASKWFRAESQHFIVHSDTSHEDVTQLLNNLEKLDYVLRIYTKDYNIERGARQKISLYYHDRMASFNEVVLDEPAEAVGLYSSCGAGVEGFAVELEPIADLSNEELVKHPLNDSLSYIFEAYTRHFLYRYTDIRSPAFFIDGFAQYFSSVRFSGSQMIMGRVPSNLARYLHFIDDGHAQQLEFKQIVEPNASMETGFRNESATRLEYLSKAWLLTHFMLSSKENFALAGKFLNAVHLDVPAATAFEDAFGIKMADASNRFWQYRRKGVEVFRFEVASFAEPRIEFTSLPEASTDFILAEAALKSCPDQKAGESLLRRLTQKAADHGANDYAKLVLSRAQIEWGNPQDALPFLTEATRKDASNAQAVYLLGMANLRLSELNTDAAAAPYLLAAKTHLSRARALDPNSAETAFALFKAELRSPSQPGEKELEGAISAFRNAHEVNTFARSAALAFAYTGRAPEADNALTLLAHNSRDLETASWATSWQKRLSSGVSRDEVLAEMRHEPRRRAAFKEWTLASADLMQTVMFNAGVENARGYLETLRAATMGAGVGTDPTPPSPMSKR